jgi:hypothetical protein
LSGTLKKVLTHFCHFANIEDDATGFDGTVAGAVSPLSLSADVDPGCVDEDRTPGLSVAGVDERALVVRDAFVLEGKRAGGASGPA